MEIDIRTTSPEAIDKIRIRCENEDEYCVEYIYLSNGKAYVGDHDSCCNKRIYNKEHALDNIKALDKAIELGWLK